MEILMDHSILIADGITDEIHEETVDTEKLVGVTKWRELVFKAHQIHSATLSIEPLERSECEFAKAGNILAMWADTSGRGCRDRAARGVERRHYVGYVMHRRVKQLTVRTRLIAKFLLSMWKG